mmetsp:Transcript_12107/g.19711  ORF Transcript_12107/g.19711 Transcript_12107/m.19711 type:complete len:488 (+) Transcript_12107:409-1872(+)
MGCTSSICSGGTQGQTAHDQGKRKSDGIDNPPVKLKTGKGGASNENPVDMQKRKQATNKKADSVTIDNNRTDVDKDKEGKGKESSTAQASARDTGGKQVDSPKDARQIDTIETGSSNGNVGGKREENEQPESVETSPVGKETTPKAVAVGGQTANVEISENAKESTTSTEGSTSTKEEVDDDVAESVEEPQGSMAKKASEVMDAMNKKEEELSSWLLPPLDKETAKYCAEATKAYGARPKKTEKKATSNDEPVITETRRMSYADVARLGLPQSSSENTPVTIVDETSKTDEVDEYGRSDDKLANWLVPRSSSTATASQDIEEKITDSVETESISSKSNISVVEDKFSSWLIPRKSSKRKSVPAPSSRRSVGASPTGSTKPMISVDESTTGVGAFSSWLIPPKNKQVSKYASSPSTPSSARSKQSATKDKPVLVNPVGDDLRKMISSVRKLSAQPAPNDVSDNLASPDDILHEVQVSEETNGNYSFRL